MAIKVTFSDDSQLATVCKKCLRSGITYGPRYALLVTGIPESNGWTNEDYDVASTNDLLGDDWKDYAWTLLMLICVSEEGKIG